MKKCDRKTSGMRRKAIYVILAPVMLICVAAVNVCAHESAVNATGKPVLTASLNHGVLNEKVTSTPEIEEALKKDTMAAGDYNDRGVDYLRKGQYDPALSEFNKALEIDQSIAEIYNNRGIAYSKKGQYDLAISDFKKALEIKPENSEFYYNVGITYAMKGQIELALPKFNRVIEINPSDAAAYTTRARIYMDLACSDWKRVCNFGNCDYLKEATGLGLCTE